MARPSVCLLASLSALLLGIAAVSRSKGLRGTESQREPRIPSQFSQEQRIAMKEALKGAIQIPTVSFSPKELNTTALAEFGEYIRKVFPTVFHTSFIRHEVVGNYSHLFTIKGSDPSMQPYMLLAHIDVVPAPDKGWDVPPFSGLERDGFIYGRGTLDNKNSLMAILQALELLLIRNYIPRRSFFIALGHDEEISGINGAQKISALLQARGVQLAFVVDEGSFILDGFIPYLKKPFAMVSVSEKGAINLMLQVNTTTGHSSAPPKETSIGILAAAVSRLEQTPMPNMFGSGPLMTAVEQLANEFPFPTNIVLNNLWLFRPLVSRLMERNYITNSLVRTTTALTMFNAGVKVNVIPPVAEAIINFRLHPAQTVQEVLKLAKDIVADDRVQFHVLDAFDPLPISPSDDQALGYQLLRQTIHSVFPEVNIVAPGTCIGNTDSRHYLNLTTGIYRFNPIYLQPQDFSSIHGINEKISVQAYETQVKFVFEFIQNGDTDEEPVPHLHEL
ncbi:N-fatty-acyl-amino acid synthase/hydrolase PM20D1 [Bos indicus]|uniref:N-fatty-acyl-amino acid synthase/hydrolase PM20D1 n=1 Tax=Bos indicus TaxID=9915 RepID=A0ABM4QKV7_BOSIN|nr:N-fatty-acyl-amino acid synthase/hydrolase PM20D1 [Bos indicus x Bos taurus]XP_027420097.1 N-fatty-acyl-amino acid synthase/hydrolase PM20D1 [Bos indicus x Bos taurus]